MAHTQALPVHTQWSLAYVPLARAGRVIPSTGQPNFGVMLNSVIPGSVVAPNAFFDRTLAYINSMLMPLPPGNMPTDQYLGFVPGLSRAPQA